MVDARGRTEAVGRVTVLTQIRCLDVVCRLADRGGAVVARCAIPRNAAMIKDRVGEARGLFFGLDGPSSLRASATEGRGFSSVMER